MQALKAYYPKLISGSKVQWCADKCLGNGRTCHVAAWETGEADAGVPQLRCRQDENGRIATCEMPRVPDAKCQVTRARTPSVGGEETDGIFTGRCESSAKHIDCRVIGCEALPKQAKSRRRSVDGGNAQMPLRVAARIPDSLNRKCRGGGSLPIVETEEGKVPDISWICLDQTYAKGLRGIRPTWGNCWNPFTSSLRYFTCGARLISLPMGGYSQLRQFASGT